MAGICPYSSTDSSAPSSGTSNVNPVFDNPNFDDVYKSKLSGFDGPGSSASSNSKTLTPSLWSSTSNNAYIAGLNPSGSGGSFSNNGYTCPYNIPNGGNNAKTTLGYSKNNALGVIA